MKNHLKKIRDTVPSLGSKTPSYSPADSTTVAGYQLLIKSSQKLRRGADSSRGFAVLKHY